MAWPVIDSSTRALSSPVWRHCEAKRLRERAATTRVSTSENGITTSDTQASSGEIDSIMIDDADDREDRLEHVAERLLEALRHVVDVVGDPAQQIAAGLPVDVRQREAR